MNSDSKYSIKNENVVGNMKLIFDCKFIGYVVFVSFGKTIFVEFPSNITGISRYYMFKDIGANVMQKIAANYFDFAFADGDPYGATQYSSEYILSKYGSNGETRTVANIKQVNNTGEFIYIINNVVYTAHFPVQWALEHESSGIGPGTSPRHCEKCNSHGSQKGVFVGYCNDCISFLCNVSRAYDEYEYTDEDDEQEYRAIREIQQQNDEKTSSIMFATYLKNILISEIGYDSDAETCLSGGAIPTTPDICNDQSDVDPVVICEPDDDRDLFSDNVFSMRESRRHPRRAYGIPGFIRHEILRTQILTPDFIRNKLEVFFVANDIEVTDNNYSFPIGHREEWDHYRTQKHPCYWYAWNILLKDCEQKTHVQVRLYLSNPLVLDNQWEVVLACNSSDSTDGNGAYWSMIQHMSDWILDNTKVPEIEEDTEDTEDTDTEDQESPEDNGNNLNQLQTEDDTCYLILYCMIVYFAIIIFTHIKY
jgi:hypothetical protein